MTFFRGFVRVWVGSESCCPCSSEPAVGCVVEFCALEVPALRWCNKSSLKRVALVALISRGKHRAIFWCGTSKPCTCCEEYVPG